MSKPAISPAAHALLPVTDQSFESEVLGSQKPFLLEFTAEWCGPCKALAPVVLGVANELAGRLAVGVIDADEFPEIGARYRVRALPTLILFQEGREVARHVGTMNRKNLREFIGAEALAAQA